MFVVRPVDDPEARRRHCIELAELLPDWFGLPDSNTYYADGIAALTCFGAFDESGTCLGLVALRRHFEICIEVWWMAVRPERHRQGIGRALMARAEAEVRRLGCHHMIVMTVGPQSEDAAYARTRAYYVAEGFLPLIELPVDDAGNALIWMIRTVGASG